MKISVTQEDIDNGIKSKCQKCPIALAIKRQNPDIFYISVGAVYVQIAATADRHPKYFRLSSSAQVFIHKFDQGKPVQPFTFVIEKPA